MQAQPQIRRAIGPLGTIARVCAGVALIAGVVSGAFGDGTQELDVLLGLVVGPALLLVWQAVRQRTTSAPLNATGPLGFLATAAIGAALIAVENTREPAILFFAVSMLLAAVRGYAGCEILAISNWVLRRDDQVGCVVFSPVDAAERALAAPSRAP